MLEDDAELEGGHDELDRRDEVEEDAEGERGASRGVGGQTLQAIASPIGDEDHEEGHCKFDVFPIYVVCVCVCVCVCVFAPTNICSV